MLIRSTMGVANTETRPHQPRNSVITVYSPKYFPTQFLKNSPPIRLWKNITADVLNEHHLPCRSLVSARMTVCVHEPSNDACDPGESALASRLRSRLVGLADRG